MNSWQINFNHLSLDKFGWREAMCTLSNGYFSMRGSLEEFRISEFNYPGTYIAGFYNALDSDINGHYISNEDLVNCPNALFTYAYPSCHKSIYHSCSDKLYFELDMRHGILFKSQEITASNGRCLKLSSRRFVSINSPHLAAIEYKVEPTNFSSLFIVYSGIDGDVANKNVSRYRELNTLHLEVVEREFTKDGLIYLGAITASSKLKVSIAVRNKIYLNENLVDLKPKKVFFSKSLGTFYKIYLKSGDCLKIEKVISLYTSKDFAIKESHLESITAAQNAKNFSELFLEHANYWGRLWSWCDLDFGKEDLEQKIIRLHIFHLVQTLSPNSTGLDYGVPARGLHGEAYRGHVFWDEIFVVPLLSLYFPELARSLLLYRFKRLDKARQLAKAAGFQGAMYPWQSASNGEEVSQKWHQNPNNKKWDSDLSSFQRHINCSIVYIIWFYYKASLDREFLLSYGAIIIFEITRFLVSLCSFSKDLQLYEIKAVVGPDEYHEQYADTQSIGVNNNAYTNVMTVWVITKALEVVHLLSAKELNQFNLSQSELEHWESITYKMYIPFHEGVISQFQAYEELKELNWDSYKTKYGNIERLDRILRAENDSTNNYKIGKQADVVMLFYLVPKDELKFIFKKLGIDLTDKIIKNSINYYLSRCSHGSSLSKLVYASVLMNIDSHQSRELYKQTLMSDFLDTHPGTVQEGIHLGMMAGTVYHHVKHSLGLSVFGELVSLNPNLVPDIPCLNLCIRVRGHSYQIHLTQNFFKLTLCSKTKAHHIRVLDKIFSLSLTKPISIDLTQRSIRRDLH